MADSIMGRALHVVGPVAKDRRETAADKIKRLQSEAISVVTQEMAELNFDMQEVATRCVEAQDFPLPPGEKEELRQVGEFVTAALDRIAGLRARNGR